MNPKRPVLIIAHPAHELTVHGWVEQYQPRVFVLTDGSGNTDRSRLASTRRVLEQVGAVPGEIFGRMTDRELYASILRGDISRFLGLAEELTDLLAAHDCDCVLGDAIEGYNSGHDVCRWLIDAAVTRLHDRGAKVANFQIALAGDPGERPQSCGAEPLRLALTNDALERKMSASDRYLEVAAEVARLREQIGIAPFGCEWLWPVTQLFAPSPGCPDVPYYEQYGMQQVTASHYREVIRFVTHMAPISEALRQYAEQSPGCAGVRTRAAA